VYDSKLYIFQIRPITKIEYKDIYYRFSNTNLNGINILSPFMISLDKQIYSDTEITFAKYTGNFSDENIAKPVVISRFSRLYWNLTFLKSILESVTGYVERYLDDSLKVRIDYLDNGNQNVGDKEKKLKIFSKKNFLDTLKKNIID